MPRDYSGMSDDQIEKRLREIRDIKYANAKQTRGLTIEEIELREEIEKRKTPECCGLAMVRTSMRDDGGSLEMWMCRKCGSVRQG